MSVSRCKLGLDEEGETEIVDLKAPPSEISALIDGKRYFWGYHMNKNHWYTICLDGTVPNEELLDASAKVMLWRKKDDFLKMKKDKGTGK